MAKIKKKTTRTIMSPEEEFKSITHTLFEYYQAYRRPAKTLPRSPGHHQEWVAACRGGTPAGSNFLDHAGLLTEVCLLGNIAVRTQKKLLWDGARMEFKDDAFANKLLHRDYRQGWTL